MQSSDYNYFKQNGLPTPAEMNGASVEKLVEHLNPDAILYVKINRWGQKFQVLDSKAVVDSELTLIDSRSGATIWESKAVASLSSSNVVGGDSFLEIIIGELNQEDASCCVSGVSCSNTHAFK